MGVAANTSNFQNYIKSTNKIPVYAREYKKEYLFIRGLNKEFKYFVDNLDKANTGLFESHKVDRIKYFIKRFLRGQERGSLQDISGFEIDENDVVNLIKIKKSFYYFKQRFDFCKECIDDDYDYDDDDDDDDDDEPFVMPYPGFENIYYDFEFFFSKLKIKYEEDIYDSDSDSDIEDVEIILPDSDSDSDIEDVEIILPDSDSDSDSDSDIF